jgi:hypothetical protein
VVAAQRRTLVKVLTPMNVLTRADGPARELLAFALAEYDASARVVLEQGATYECKTEAGAIMRRARPEQAIAADAWRRAAQMLASFGWTPGSRAKVEVLPPETSGGWAGLIGDPMERLLHRREGSVAAFQRRRRARLLSLDAPGKAERTPYRSQSTDDSAGCRWRTSSLPSLGCHPRNIPQYEP